MLDIGDKVRFKDGRGKGRIFTVSGVNGKTYLPNRKQPQSCVDVEFQAFGLIACLRRVEKTLLEKADG